MWFLHHFVRVIWANILGMVYNTVYAFRLCFDKKLRDKCADNMEKWGKIDSIDSLIKYIKDVYIYKYDGYKGFIDHNNYNLEWFSAFGDCDDIAYWVFQAIKSIYGDKLEYCQVHGFADLSAKPKFWHYDCVYKLRDEDFYVLFDYGRLHKLPDNKQSLSDKMTNIYGSSYKTNKMTNWKCLWM